MIQVKHLAKEFKISTQKGKLGLKSETEVVTALSDISFSIKPGEFVALLGPNGAGKSTLIKILIGVLASSGGEVKVLGVDPLENRAQITGHLGVVFGQRSRLWYDLPVKDSFNLTKELYLGNSNFFDWKSMFNFGRKNITKNADHEAKNKADKEFQEWLDYLIDSIDIRNLLDRPVKKLSLGEKMRCELVNTLLYNPDLIFLDEPTIGLDVVSKQKIREALKILHAKGKTIILTSHDTGDIEKLCERVMVINHGSLVVDLQMKEFLKLSDNQSVNVLLNIPISPDKWELWLTKLNDLGLLDEQNSLIKISELEVELNCSKARFPLLIKEIFSELDVADLKIQAQGIEKVLLELYK